MKNKGFVFIETIVVIVLLSLGLVMVYQSFANVLTNNKRRATYNDIAYIYRTFYIEEFISSLNIEDYINSFLDNKNIEEDDGKLLVTFSCDNPILYDISSDRINNNKDDDSLPVDAQNKKEYCQDLRSNFKVKNIYITKYNVNDLKKCTTRSGKTLSKCTDDSSKYKYEALSSMSPSMIFYLRTLHGTNDDAYRLIIEYEEELVDNDSSVVKVTREGKKECPNSFVEGTNDKCLKKIKRKYYSNVALIKKGE